MRKIGRTKKEIRNMVLGAILAISVCTLLFSTLTKVVKAEFFRNRETVPTTYNSDSISKTINSGVPAGYVKSNYKVELVETPEKPAEKDMPIEEAAELGAQNLWLLFDEKLTDQTVYMTYIPANESQKRALWYGEVNINDVLNYNFQVDAITGEYYTFSRWDYSKETGEATEFLVNYQEYLSLAKDTAEKYNLISGNITSSEYIQQRTMGAGKVVIDILVKSDNGQEVQLTFSTYSKELTYVSYNSELQQEKNNLEKGDK